MGNCADSPDMNVGVTHIEAEVGNPNVVLLHTGLNIANLVGGI